MIKFEKIKEDIRKYFPQMMELLQKDKDIVLAYLFGSYSSGNIGPLSDVDIAILLDKKFPRDKYFNKQLQLITEVNRILHTGEIDLVILNEAPLILQYSVMKNGSIIFFRNEIQRIRFEASVGCRYLDTTRMRDEYFYFLSKKIREGRITDGYRRRKYQQSLTEIERMYGKTRTP